MSHLSFHFYEFLYRLFYPLISLIFTFFLCTSYHLELLLTILSSTNSESSLFIISNPLDSLYTYFYLSLFISSFYIGLPLLLIQLYLFIRPSLFFNNRPFIDLSVLFSSLLLFLLTNTISLKILQLFISLLQEPIKNIGQSSLLLWLPNIKNIVELYTFITLILFVYLISPLFLIYLQHKYGLLGKFLQKRQYMYYIVILVISIITPPDIITLLVMSVPFIVLIEGSYFMSLVLTAYLGQPQLSLGRSNQAL